MHLGFSVRPERLAPVSGGGTASLELQTSRLEFTLALAAHLHFSQSPPTSLSPKPHLQQGWKPASVYAASSLALLPSGAFVPEGGEKSPYCGTSKMAPARKGVAFPATTNVPSLRLSSSIRVGHSKRPSKRPATPETATAASLAIDDPKLSPLVKRTRTYHGL